MQFGEVNRPFLGARLVATTMVTVLVPAPTSARITSPKVIPIIVFVGREGLVDGHIFVENVGDRNKRNAPVDHVIDRTIDGCHCDACEELVGRWSDGGVEDFTGRLADVWLCRQSETRDL